MHNGRSQSFIQARMLSIDTKMNDLWSITTLVLCCTISEMRQLKGRKSSFFHDPSHLTPSGNFWMNLIWQKLESRVYPLVIIAGIVLIQYQWQSNKHIDKRCNSSWSCKVAVFSDATVDCTRSGLYTDWHCYVMPDARHPVSASASASVRVIRRYFIHQARRQAQSLPTYSRGVP